MTREATANRSGRSGSAGDFGPDGATVVDPFSVDGVRRVARTVGWGASRADRLRISAYYALRILSRLMRRDRNLVGGMYPKYWLGNVTINTPIGRFHCRARTIDFDIVNPNYEVAEVEAFHTHLSSLTTGRIVCFDVGAHIGKFSILAGRILGDRGGVFAFEPEPESFALLQKNVNLNNLKNVYVFNLACGSRDTNDYLRLSTTNIGAHTLLERPGAERIPVQVRSLDSFATEKGVSHVNVIKIDVEGTEAEVLKGSRRILESNPEITVFFEEHDQSGNAESVRFLHTLGFSVRKLTEDTCVASRLS